MKSKESEDEVEIRVSKKHSKKYHHAYTSNHYQSNIFPAPPNGKQAHATANRQLGKGARNRLLEYKMFTTGMTS